jgi:hypothetical protein
VGSARDKAALVLPRACPTAVTPVSVGLVVHREALPADPAEVPPVDRLPVVELVRRRVATGVRAELTVQLFIGEPGQQHPAAGCEVGGQHPSFAVTDSEDVIALGRRDETNVAPDENQQVGGLADLIHELAQVGSAHRPQPGGGFRRHGLP